MRRAGYMGIVEHEGCEYNVTGLFKRGQNQRTFKYLWK